ncbi:hypothetical protein AQ1_02436 [alpha proteobacterium Q-1]|nr:hypothetical protein AQ1_02436 [alpha proteobacterium Q-1]
MFCKLRQCANGVKHQIGQGVVRVGHLLLPVDDSDKLFASGFRMT